MTVEGTNHQLSMNQTIKIVVKFKQEFIGRYQDRLKVQFKDVNRLLESEVRDKKEVQKYKG